jgi:hypothetical protein
MGDASDTSDLERFMRSPEGQDYLEKFRYNLLEQQIIDVLFYVEDDRVMVFLKCATGNSFHFQHRELSLDWLWENFGDVLQREYYRDYPERKPNQG